MFVDSPIGSEGSVVSNAHVQNVGWQNDCTSTADWTPAREVTGTTGSSLRMEALQMALTGDLAQAYDIYYRVHVANIGWMDWASDGAKAGTTGYLGRIEACQVYLLGKGQTPSDTASDCSYPYFQGIGLRGSGYVQYTGQQKAVGSGKLIGTVGQSKQLEGITLALTGVGGADQLSGSIAYKVHEAGTGWTGWVYNGDFAGTQGESTALQAVKVKLTGDVTDFYDVYYRSHVEDLGSLGVTYDGRTSGTTGCSLDLQGVWVYIVAKGQPAPSGPHAFSAVSNNTTVNLEAPCFNQYDAGLPTGCESAALTDLLRYWGFNIGDSTIADAYMPWSDDEFVYSFMGNPHSYHGNSLMSPGITNTANSFLSAAGSSLRATNVSGMDLYSLYDYITIGQPLVVWSTVDLEDTGSPYYGPEDGYYLYHSSHAVVLDGYDRNTGAVHVSDSISGQCWRNASRFAEIFREMGSQAVLIS